MSEGWRMVPLGEVLVERKERVASPDADGLPLLGVSNKEGLHRSSKERISDMSRYLRVERDWFAYNPMRINVGSIGWAECDAQTGVISPDYVVFSCTDRVLPRLLYLFLRSRAGLKAINLETAGSVRERLYFNALSRIRFPLTSLAEQHRIVARIEETSAKVEQARALRNDAIRETSAWITAHLDRAFGDPQNGRPGALVPPYFRRMDDVIVDVADGPHVTPTYVEDGVPFVTVLNITSGRIDFRGAKHITWDDHRLFQRRARAEPGDVLISKDGTIGVPCFVDTDREFSFFVSVALIKPKRDLLDGEFLTWALRAPYVQRDILARSRGDMIRHLVLREIRDLTIPLPPLAAQRRIVTYLDSLQARLAVLKRLQTQTQAELDALLPAILDRAFRGEL